MTLSQEDFFKVCSGAVAGFGVSQMFHPDVRDLLQGVLTEERFPVFWTQGQSCTGCSVTLLNSLHPTIAEIILKIISMQYHPLLMASEGSSAVKHMLDLAERRSGEYIYIVEGSIPTAGEGKYCVIGKADGRELTMLEATEELGRKAAVVLAVGVCSAYGGIPAARGQQTGATGITQFFSERNIKTPVINIGGCPPHPDWVIGTLAMLLGAMKRKGVREGVAELQDGLDSAGRPRVFFPNTHKTCPYLPDFVSKKFSKMMNDKVGCRVLLGCKGPKSFCDTYKRKWNGGVNWCIDNATCIGCTQPDFPDGKSPFYK